MGLNPNVVTSLQAQNFITATPIQEKSIPVALTKVDLVARAKNGTGKTASFLIPIINSIVPTVKTVQAVIIVNTRELAMQISDVAQKLGDLVPGVKNRVLCLIGGCAHKDDIQRISQHKPSIVIGTPFKLKVFIEQNLLNVSQAHTFVVDEADKIISEEEFLSSLIFIKQSLHADHYTMLFSATFQDEILNFTQEHMEEPVFINCQDDKLTLTGITQYVAELRSPDLKLKLLSILFKSLQIRQAIIFVNTTQKCEQVQYLVQTLIKIPSSFVHSKLTPEQRSIIFHDFAQGHSRVLVTTDLYTRGIDIRTVNVVINFDVPRSADEYLHRIGRCGRFGHRGLAITIFSGEAEKKICLEIDESLNSPMIPLPASLDKIPTSQYAISDDTLEM